METANLFFFRKQLSISASQRFAVESSFPFPAAELSLSHLAGFLITFCEPVMWYLPWGIKGLKTIGVEGVDCSVYLYLFIFFNYQEGCSSATLLNRGQDLSKVISQLKPQSQNPLQ